MARLRTSYRLTGGSSYEPWPLTTAARSATAVASWSEVGIDPGPAARIRALANAGAFGRAEVYNLTGYVNRKLGKMDDAFRNYKIALQMNPNHRGAHEYAGEAYLITNNLAMAEQHLAALDRICGSRGCEEYDDLAREIAEYKKKH